MTYGVTAHATSRYKQRVRRDLRWRAARRELLERCQGAALVHEAPVWIAGDQPEPDGYLMLDSDTAALVQGRTVVTVVTRQWADRWVRQKCAELGWTRESAAA